MESKFFPEDLNLDVAKRLWRKAVDSVPPSQPTPFPPNVPQVIVGGWDGDTWRSLNVGLIHRACEKLLEEIK